MPVTIQDIARATQTSHSTVSRALRNQSVVNSETKEKIFKAAQKLGYRPSHAGRTLKSGKTHTIGLILPNMINPYYLEMLQALKEECLARGYQLISIDYGMDPKQERLYLEQMLGRRCDGIFTFLSRFEPVRDLIREFWAARLPFIVMGLPLDMGELKVDGVELKEIGIEKAVDHLVSLGHREIVMAISCTPECEIGRHEALVNAFRKYGLPFSRNSYVSHFSGDQLQDGRICAKEVLQRNPLATAVIGVNDVFILGFMRGLMELGKKVPDDISLIGTDNTWVGRNWPVALTSIDLKTKEYAQAAASILFERLTDDRWNEPKHIYLESDLVIRESTGPVRRHMGKDLSG